MKKILGIFVAILAVTSAQRSPFVDYILDLQYAVGYIHSYIEETTWAHRHAVSDELTKINENSVTHIFNALSEVITIRNQTDAAIEDVRGTGNAECIDAVAAAWQLKVTIIGLGIQECGNPTVPVMYNATNDFHRFVNSNRQIQFDAQNIVIQTFTELNPMTEVLELSPRVEQNINTVYDQFEADVHPGLRSSVAGFETLATEIPADFETCIAAFMETFRADAETTTVNAWAC